MNERFIIPEELRGSIVAVRIMSITPTMQTVGDGRRVGIGVIWESDGDGDQQPLQVVAELELKHDGEAARHA